MLLQLDLFSCKYGCNQNFLQLHVRLQLKLQPRFFLVAIENFLVTSWVATENLKYYENIAEVF
jgi:hypothetical protein